MPSLKETLQKARNTKSTRIRFLVLLLVILAVMYFIGGKAKILLLVLMVLVLGAIGLQVTDYDLDIETLWETGSIQESRVEHKDGMKLIGKCLSDNINCSNFTTQDEAQAMYEDCAQEIASYNDGVENVKSLDVYGLDRDKDGIVCESLPAAVAN